MLKLAGPPGAVVIAIPCVSTPRRAQASSSRPVDPPEAWPRGLGEPVVRIENGVELRVARGEEGVTRRVGLGDGEGDESDVFAPLGRASGFPSRPPHEETVAAIITTASKRSPRFRWVRDIAGALTRCPISHERERNHTRGLTRLRHAAFDERYLENLVVRDRSVAEVPLFAE